MPDIFGAPGLAVVVVAGKMLVRLKIASDVLALALALAHMPDQGELTHLVHVHDLSHNSYLIHVLSCYLHSFYIFFLDLPTLFIYYVSVT